MTKRNEPANHIEEILRQPYARTVIPVEDGFHAEILEFPGCFAVGDSVAEAYARLEETAYSWIEACLEQDQRIPSPFANAEYSGRIMLRLPKSIHRQAARAAERDGVSLNQFLMSAVACRVGAEDLYVKMARRFESKGSRAT